MTEGEKIVKVLLGCECFCAGIRQDIVHDDSVIFDEKVFLKPAAVAADGAGQCLDKTGAIRLPCGCSLSQFDHRIAGAEIVRRGISPEYAHADLKECRAVGALVISGRIRLEFLLPNIKLHRQPAQITKSASGRRRITEIAIVKLHSYYIGNRRETQPLVPAAVRRIGIAYFHNQVAAVKNSRSGMNRLRIIRRAGCSAKSRYNGG